eukprot:TRINITY_DN2131_c0_g1_i1.p1 TRINITY_DN2131_c0_g1~~TRINITY_DN2131_c0_g1_i1.p1  ORF type:complete len:542 (-),score=64.06 TRINITY_DN2131_c0_g1_i1:2049-3674(-)
MDSFLPSDVWLLIATRLARTSGRNGVLALRATSRSLKAALQDSAALWKEMIFQYHFRLFTKADPAFIADMTAERWRKLLFGFCALGLRSSGDEIDFLDETRKNVFSWIDAFAEKESEDEEADDSRAPSGEHLKWNKDIIYDFQMDINTASFWFSHRKAKDGSPLDIKIADLVNGDPMRKIESGDFVSLISNDELVQSLYSIFPKTHENKIKLTAFHTVIVPEYIDKSKENRVVDPLYGWNEWKSHPERNIGCYRYKAPSNSLPFIDLGANDVYHILLPLQDPERVGFNEDRIRFYQEEMRQGSLPTVLALSCVHNKYRLADSDDASFPFRSQVVLVHLIVDGHHKLEAARRLNWPVGILSICDDARRSLCHQILNPIPSLPMSSLEFARFVDRSGPYILMFDNFLECFGGNLPVSEQRALLEKLLCRGGHRPEDVFRSICIPLESKPWDNCLMHGGLIEFTTFDQMMRVLDECSGCVEGGLGPIAFQVLNVLESEGWNLKYDLSTPGGPRPVRLVDYEDGNRRNYESRDIAFERRDGGRDE